MALADDENLDDLEEVAVRCPHCLEIVDELDGEVCPDCAEALREECAQCGQLFESDVPEDAVGGDPDPLCPDCAALLCEECRKPLDGGDGPLCAQCLRAGWRIVSSVSAEGKLLEALQDLDWNPQTFAKHTPLSLLSEIWGHKNFRPEQQEIIDRVSQRDVLGVLPTGGGKSICFQIPALLAPGLTVVITPIRALMRDQFDNLRKVGLNCVYYINSDLQSDIRSRILEKVCAGKVKILYVSPEPYCTVSHPSQFPLP